jgi:hypothetical protein
VLTAVESASSSSSWWWACRVVQLQIVGGLLLLELLCQKLDSGVVDVSTVAGSLQLHVHEARIRLPALVQGARVKNGVEVVVAFGRAESSIQVLSESRTWGFDNPFTINARMTRRR